LTSFKFLGATLVLSALLATPASAWQSASEPAAAAASDPNFSIYSNDGRGYSGAMASQAPLVDASGPHVPVRPHRGNHAAGVKRH
jgi:tripartite-type tricarboxylate transporter receptor subunit TctC